MACGRSFPGSVEASRSGAKNVSRQSDRSSAGSSSRARHSTIRSICSLAFFWEDLGLLTQSVSVLISPNSDIGSWPDTEGYDRQRREDHWCSQTRCW